ncbi:MAG: tripartite tricarboxylate transporter TctB family protein [Pseudomonadota bacterium]
MVKAESVIAAALMGLSIWFMWSASELSIWWEDGTGPGGGAFPFWLSAIMLGCSAMVLWRSLGATVDTGAFFDPDTIKGVAVVVGALLATIAIIPWLGAYVAITLFLFGYLKLYGRHGWVLSLILTIATPVFLFFFFEVTLRILLPKGITEPWFFPLYRMFF